MTAIAPAQAEVGKAPGTAESTWAPLRFPIFRALFVAQLGSNIGNWMETVGAQWLVVDHPHASTLVALVQTADMLPFVFLALPAGVLADTLDRRRYLIAVHLFLTATATLLAAATYAGMMRPSLLLALTFIEGAGSALAIPAWQAIVPELVPRSQLPAASALASINQNLARAIGPAIAGFMISGVGVATVFAVNALTFVFGIIVMLMWRRSEGPADDLGREELVPALRAGMRYVRHSRVVRRLLLRVTLFIVPATSLWALLPVIANQLLALGPSGYGMLLGSLGGGAIVAAIMLPRLRMAFTPGRLAGSASAIYAAVLIVAAFVPRVAIVVPSLVVAGAAWIVVLVEFNASLQIFLPNWVRARGLSIYQLTFMGGQALSAAVWGLVAQHAGIGVALAAAAALLVVGAATIVWWPTYNTTGLDRNPAVYWPEPTLALKPNPDDGPVLVTVRYRVPDGKQVAFVQAMEEVARVRRRTGAIQWDLFRDGEDPRRFVELYAVRTWEEHLRQHRGRLTGSDRMVEERARALTEGPPEIEHLFPADAIVRPK
jgi:MFS family permease